MPSSQSIATAYRAARERYAALGVDTDQVLETLGAVHLSLHCWQGDDVRGFEHQMAGLSQGGLQVTGGYPGRARTIGELRQDLEKAYTLIPGSHRLNLHAMYGDFGEKPVDRDAITPDHFRTWMEWGRSQGIHLDFNSTCFAHPKAESGFTLSSEDPAIRGFWIEHVRRSRIIAEAMGQAQGDPCIHNLWIPDGAKDITLRRALYRSLLRRSLDTIFADRRDPRFLKDAVESKLFGIGSEAFVVGSHEFYLAYAIRNQMMLCLDMGHFHPTESVADKVSSVLEFSDELLLHVSRGIRWDSDHVVIVNDDVASLMLEITRAQAMPRTHIALDFFDASLNRVGAWVVGARATLAALLQALLEPHARLVEYEASGDFFARLALLEVAKTLPWGAVWDYHCEQNGTPAGEEWIGELQSYERAVLSRRG
jgi:L-rhamnose isomerase